MEPSPLPERPERDAELIERFVATGNPEPLDLIIRRYSPKLRRLLSTMLGSRVEEIADAEQEVFLTLVTRAHRFRGRAKFSTFFYSLARNRVLDYVRNRSRYVARNSEEVTFELVETEEPGPQTLLIEEERKSAVRAALDRLKPDDRFLLFMKEVEGMGVRELAELVGMRENTVKSRLKRGREKMARLLEEHTL